MTVLMCGHCYRPAVSAIYVRPRWRRRVQRRQVCAACVERYRRGWRP